MILLIVLRNFVVILDFMNTEEYGHFNTMMFQFRVIDFKLVVRIDANIATCFCGRKPFNDLLLK